MSRKVRKGAIRRAYNRLVLDEAYYLLENKSTLRACAKEFERGRSTIHKDMREALPSINPALARRISALFEENLQQRAVRGGQALKRKWIALKHPVADNSI